jgi:hypothetical protein
MLRRVENNLQVYINSGKKEEILGALYGGDWFF